jgi:hypothetical protein
MSAPRPMKCGHCGEKHPTGEPCAWIECECGHPGCDHCWLETDYPCHICHCPGFVVPAEGR